MSKYITFVCIIMNWSDINIEKNGHDDNNDSRHTMESYSLFVVSTTRHLLALFISACNNNIENNNDNINEVGEEEKHKLLTFCIRVILH